MLTFGLALVIEGCLHQAFGCVGQSYPVPAALRGVFNLGFMILPIYRAWVILVSVVVCFSTWFVIERTRLGATLRAATENAPLLQAFGVNVPFLVAATYGGGVALAALAGVLSAPVILVSPPMGSSLVIVVFAVVVIGGMGSILGAIVSGLALGVIEGFTKVIYPEASNIVVFVIMALVLMFAAGRPVRQGIGPMRSRPVFYAAGRPVRTVRSGVRNLSGVHDEAAVLRDVRVRFQPVARIQRHAVIRPRGILRHLGLRDRMARDGAQLGAAAAALAGVISSALRRSSSACIAIRRRGIYFAMITLALAQLIYFVCLEAPFTGGENGLQGVPRGSLLGVAAEVRHRSCTIWCWRFLAQYSCSSGGSCIRRSVRC